MIQIEVMVDLGILVNHNIFKKSIITKFFFAIIISVFIFSCKSLKINKISNDYEIINNEKDLEYYYAFTEATKLALFGKYNDAVSLYMQCLKVNPKSSATYFQISNIYFRNKQLDIAKKYALEAYKLEENNYWYLVHLASIYQMQLNLDSTIIFYEKLVELKKDDIDSKINLALLYRQNNDYKKSLRVIEKIEKTYGYNERIIFLKHDIYNNLNRKKAAVIVLEKGISLYPENIDIYGMLAEFYSDNGKYSEAESAYKKIFSIDSMNQKAILSYADFLINNGNGNRAFSLYNRLFYDEETELDNKILLLANFIDNLETVSLYKHGLKEKIEYLDSNYKDIRINALAIDYLLKSNDYYIASERIKDLIKKINVHSFEYERLLYIENHLERYDSVVYYADIAISEYSDKPLFYLFKGNALMKLNKINEALRIFKDGLEYSDSKQSQIRFYSYIGECFNLIQEFDSSDYYFEKALRNEENNLIIRNNYSYYLAAREERLDYAEKLSKLTIKIDRKNSTYLDTYAWILFKMGKLKLSLRYIELAIKFLKQENDEIYDHYGDILYKSSAKLKAIDAWKISYNIKKNETVQKKIDDTKIELNK